MVARRLLFALLLALLVSGSAVFFLSRRLSHSQGAAQPPNRYVAAAHTIDPGEILRRQDLTLVDWPRANPLSGSFVRVDDVVGRTVLYPMTSGQPVLDQELAPAGSGMGLTARIPAGMRAIALHSDEIVGVAGFLMPGTHVDVLVTYHDTKEPDPVTATVLQNAEVLAVGHQLQPDPSGKPANVDVVTLLLSPQDAEKAVLASAQGSIHFVLRNGTDHAATATPPVLLGELGQTGTTEPVRHPGASHRPAAPPQPRRWVVETLLGAKRSTDSFAEAAHD